MKFFTKKRTVKAISIILIITSLLTFALPNYSQAADFGGKLFKPISQLILAIGDVVISFLQRIFIGEGQIAIISPVTTIDNNYVIRYSPGIIFSGKVRGLDINFISPLESQEYDSSTKIWMDIGHQDDIDMDDIKFDPAMIQQEVTGGSTSNTLFFKGRDDTVFAIWSHDGDGDEEAAARGEIEPEDITPRDQYMYVYDAIDSVRTFR